MSKPYTVVVWGDSIAAGGGQISWPSLAERTANLVNNLGRPVKVINESVGGMPAARAREQFRERLLPHQPDLVFIQFGFNDLRCDGTRGADPISTPAEFAEHLSHMVARCRQELGATVVLLGNHRTSLSLLQMPHGYSYDATRAQYNEVTRTVAEKLSVRYYDLSVELRLPDYTWADLICEDGVHLSPLGFHAYGRFAASIIMELQQQENRN